MSKVLYPKVHPTTIKKAKSRKRISVPYHVLYTDPSGQLDPEWRHYTHEAIVRVAAWYHCKFSGFRPSATLYTTNEFLTETAKNSTKKISAVK
jgi:hypothetical protein